jgi:excisionase family DNA binding protein
LAIIYRKRIAMEKLLLKPKEAAEAVGIGRTLFYHLVKAGVIPSCRVGKSIRIPVAALKAWAEALVSVESAAGQRK